jgi:hypothetical protein
MMNRWQEDALIERIRETRASVAAGDRTNPRLEGLMVEAQRRAADHEGTADTHVSPLDTISCRFRREWSPEFYFFHNGVAIEQDRAFELTCGA